MVVHLAGTPLGPGFQFCCPECGTLAHHATGLRDAQLLLDAGAAIGPSGREGGDVGDGAEATGEEGHPGIEEHIEAGCRDLAKDGALEAYVASIGNELDS